VLAGSLAGADDLVVRLIDIVTVLVYRYTSLFLVIETCLDIYIKS
jgi:hypothetical protein